MESPAQTCVRLVAALEDLAAQEAACLGTSDYATLAALQERAAPFVEFLAQHGPEVANRALKERIFALMAKRDATVMTLTGEMERAREQLGALQANQRRVARVAPAYSQGSAPRRQISMVG